MVIRMGSERALLAACMTAILSAACEHLAGLGDLVNAAPEAAGSGSVQGGAGDGGEPTTANGGRAESDKADVDDMSGGAGALVVRETRGARGPKGGLGGVASEPPALEPCALDLSRLDACFVE